ncbi:MAG: hypothetical protein JWO09_3656 [Bacteroidetes bacterium]|nr:hypothetical protein [Bacteroidota bacterium]
MQKKLSGSQSKFEASLVLSIGALEYQLDGSFSDGSFSVKYSKDIHNAIDLGSVSDGLKMLGNVLLGKDGGKKLLEEIESFVKELPGIFQDVTGAFLNAHVMITRLEITTKPDPDKSVYYALGLGLRFTKKISLAGIELEYFTFEYEGTTGKKSVMKSLTASSQTN